MPACGTVTTSPACRGMLFRVSPLSMSSFRLMVMMLPEEKGVPGELSGVTGEVFAISVAEGNAGELEFASFPLRGGASEAGESVEVAAPGAEVALGSGFGTWTKVAEW